MMISHLGPKVLFKQLCVQWKSPPTMPQKSSHTTRGTTFIICFIKFRYFTKFGHLFLTSIFYFSLLYIFFPIYFVSIHGSTKAIALYEQLDDAEAVAELAEAKSQLPKHRRRLKRSFGVGHDTEELRWERKMQTAKTRRRPSWTTERWNSEKLVEMDTCHLNYSKMNDERNCALLGDVDDYL